MSETKLKSQAVDLTKTISFSRITMSTSQSVSSGSDTKINFDTASYDTNSEFNTTSDKWIASGDGYIHLDVQVSPSTNHSSYLQLYVYKNGSRSTELYAFGAGEGTYQTSIQLSGDISIEEDDEIEIYLQIGSSVTINGANSGASYLCITGYYS